VAGPRHAVADTGTTRLPDSEKVRRLVGCGLYAMGIGLGAILLIVVFVVVPLADGLGAKTFLAMAIGALLAFPAMVMYLTVPRLLDRYDPEPWYALVMAIAWGGIAACGISALVNTLVAVVIPDPWGTLLSLVVSAPVMEEGTKGILVLGFFYFLRREFDGVVDGIIYATFVAIGFAAVENVIYYARAGLDGGIDDLRATFVLRGLFFPWGHPLYTSMTGIGVGLAREAEKTWIKWLAPVGGYTAAVTLHAIWNGSAAVLPQFGGVGVLGWCCSIFLWLLFVIAFLGMVVWLVGRRGRIIRDHLVDEVALGHITKAELEIVASAFGGFTAYWRKGSAGLEFVRAVARLALSKWHSARAMRGKKVTISMDFIAPLRRRIRELRAQGASPV
jgi:RsiW-degrading membrane proteinase PrsW (M82 family)